MQDRTPTATPVLDFTPVPRKPRHDGWTAERQRAFIEALADTGSVTHAAKRINMSPEGAYHLRRQPGAESFRAAWAAALDHGVQRLTDLAIDRAVEGVAVPVFWKGEQVGEKRQYNDRLLTWVLRHHQPGGHGPDGRGDALTPREKLERDRLERVKEQEAQHAASGIFHQRIAEMAERMAAYDPTLDVSNESVAGKLVYIVFRLWPRAAEDAGDAYLREVDPEKAHEGDLFAAVRRVRGEDADAVRRAFAAARAWGAEIAAEAEEEGLRVACYAGQSASTTPH